MNFRGTKERFVRVLTLKKLYKYSSEAKSDDEEGSDGEDGGAAGRKDRKILRNMYLLQ